MINGFKKFQVWSLKWSASKWGAWVLFFCAFADASFLPLPTLMFFIALSILNKTKSFNYALIGTLGSLFGAITGYTIGHFAWLNSGGEYTRFAQFVFNNIPGFTETVYTKIQLLYVKWDFWILFVASLLPLPYKIFSISSGVFNTNIVVFCFATFISQGIKFYLMALLTIKFGRNVKKLLAFKLKPIAVIITACIAIVFALTKIF